MHALQISGILRYQSRNFKVEQEAAENVGIFSYCRKLAQGTFRTGALIQVVSNCQLTGIITILAVCVTC